MDGSLVLLSDRRAMAKMNGKTVYIRCITPSREREDYVAPGECRIVEGTGVYELDPGDGLDPVRVTECIDFDGALYQALANRWTGSRSSSNYFSLSTQAPNQGNP